MCGSAKSCLQRAFLFGAKDSPNQVPTCHSGLKTACMHAEWVDTVDTKCHCSAGLWGGGASDFNLNLGQKVQLMLTHKVLYILSRKVRLSTKPACMLCAGRGLKRHKPLCSNPPQLDRV